jgi:hypothetical protein
VGAEHPAPYLWDGVRLRRPHFGRPWNSCPAVAWLSLCSIQANYRLVADGVIEGYAIAGAVAAIFYTEPTDTVDLDILVAFPKTDSFITLGPMENEGIVIEGIPVQFLPTTNALSEEIRIRI